MQLLPHQTCVSALRELACEAIELIAAHKFDLLVDRYGYAVALGRGLVEAVKDDLTPTLIDASGDKLLTPAPHELTVAYYAKNNDWNLLATIDCELPTLGGRRVWVSFVVSGTEEKQFFTLEQILVDSSLES